tara:strand:- start:14 stop:271 length:258 start_codon:yes stop_codon:yes gene_type:complete
MNNMQHKIVRTGKGCYPKQCESCKIEFITGDDRHEWRMFLLSNRYLSGSFWTTHCHECFVKTVISWKDTLVEEIEAMPECMRELA